MTPSSRPAFSKLVLSIAPPQVPGDPAPVCNMVDNLYQILDFNSKFEDCALTDDAAKTSAQLVVQEVLCEKEGANLHQRA